MYRKQIFTGIIFSFAIMINTVFSQNPKRGEVFQDHTVPRIDIRLHPDSLNQLIRLGSQGDNHHYLSTVIFDNGTVVDTVERVGVRLRGNTSRGSQKKSFKLSFNTYEPGRKFYGLEKMNINGEHNDPSIIRSKLAWDILRKMDIPAPRANHVRLYINNQYIGLYINVEHIDEEFAQSRFGSQDGNLYKCTFPATLEYLGNDPDLYKQEQWEKRPYELKTNTDLDDYSDLAHFIDVLNNTPIEDLECALEKVFNVDSYLKIIAFEMLSAHWDGPIYLKNNFYLYNDPITNKFELIPFDLDNTFGIDWFIGDLATRNLYNWKPEGEARPLYTRIMSLPTYRDRFSFYTQQLLEEIFNPTELHPYLDSLKTQIDPYIAGDSFRGRDYGWDVEDYHTSFEEAIGQHVTYGLKPYIIERYESALGQLELVDIAPIISSIQPPLALINTPFSFSAKVIDDKEVSLVELCYAMGAEEAYNCLPMELINDPNTFRATLEGSNEAITIQIQQYPSCGSFSLTIQQRTLPLYINEIQARNTTTLSDEAGEFDDWIELYNAGEESIDLSNIFLSDNEERPDKWQFPTVSIPAKSFLLIWADEDQEQGERHSNFKLNGDGEFIGLFEKVEESLVLIDGFTFGEQSEDSSYGRMPDGGDQLQAMMPTPNASNGLVSSVPQLPEFSIEISPNPTSNLVSIALPSTILKGSYIKVLNLIGQPVFEKEVAQSPVIWDMHNLPTGTYLLQGVNQGTVFANKFIVKHN